eukprot:3338279-Prymnesium_polylepis.1
MMRSCVVDRAEGGSAVEHNSHKGGCLRASHRAFFASTCFARFAFGRTGEGQSFRGRSPVPVYGSYNIVRTTHRHRNCAGKQRGA